MNLIFLGTGAGKPYLNRNVSAMALSLQHEGHGIWLFDCGEGSQQQIMRSTVNPSKINKIFITHLHADHVLGLPGLLTSHSMSVNPEPITVYGPHGIKELLDTILRITGSFLTFPLEVIEISEGLVFQDETFKVTAVELEHRVASFGYRIEQADLPGKLDMDKITADGIGVGSHLQKIKQGQNVTQPDGRLIEAKKYLGSPKKGKTIVILGDTAPSQRAVDLAQGADLLVHEATLEEGQEEKANSRGHSTTTQAAHIALQSGVKQLILTHISARYHAQDEPRLLAQSRAIFPKTQLAHDLQTFDLDK